MIVTQTKLICAAVTDKCKGAAFTKAAPLLFNRKNRANFF